MVGILPCYSALVTLHLEYAVSSSAFLSARQALEGGKKGGPEMIKGQEHLSLKERLRELELYSLEKKTQ